MMRFLSLNQRRLAAILAALALVCCGLPARGGQEQPAASPRRGENGTFLESAHSDKFTGGTIEKSALVPGEPEIEITVDVPAFRLTLWQNGKEVKTYRIGVGRKDYPIFLGERSATEVIWNPSWIPPDSDWVERMDGIKPGEEIKAGDPRNPIGKMKIPLGYGYLIHQAKGPGDLGNLVSHGCVRMLQTDLYDLGEKIVAARGLPISRKQIAQAKRGTKMLVARLDSPLPVEISYDTMIVEGGVLSIYPDVYDRGTNTIEELHEELETNGVDASRISNATLRRMLARATGHEKFEVSLSSLIGGRALLDGRTRAVVQTPRPAPRKRDATR